MAMPVIMGSKSESERFAGADETYTIEALMQDGKALQAGTSHFLGQNFAKAFDVQYTTREGKKELVWATSWGVSTRLMGALIMTHSDDLGLVLPPRLAPIQVVIVPIYKGDDQLEAIREHITPLMENLKLKGVTVKFDDDDTRKPGWKFAEHELKGVPLRVAIGNRDLENGTLELARRDLNTKESIAFADAADIISVRLEEIQESLFNRALEFRKENITEVDTFEEFKEVLEKKGGFILTHWDGTGETEQAIKKETNATIRCIPFAEKPSSGKCVYSGAESNQRVMFAKAY